MLRRCSPFLVLLAVALCGPTLYAQAAAAAGAPPVPAEAANEWGGALVWAFFSSSMLEWIKRHPTLSLISERTAWGMQRLAGVILSLAAAMGVHTAFDSTAGTFLVTGLAIPSMWTIGTESARQWVLQELTYRTAVKPYGKPADTLIR